MYAPNKKPRKQRSFTRRMNQLLYIIQQNTGKNNKVELYIVIWKDDQNTLGKKANCNSERSIYYSLTDIHIKSGGPWGKELSLSKLYISKVLKFKYSDIHMQSTAFIIKNDTTLLKSIFSWKIDKIFSTRKQKIFLKNKKYMHWKITGNDVYENVKKLGVIFLFAYLYTFSTGTILPPSGWKNKSPLTLLV